MYSYLITFKKVLKQLIILIITLIAAGLLTEYPEIANSALIGGFTIYTLLQFLADWLKHKWNVNLP